MSGSRKNNEQAHARHVENIGWRFENMWPLAWALGFTKRPPVAGEQIDHATVLAIVLKFLPGLEFGPADLVARANPRTDDEIVALEDLFYCAHNAVRSAQLGAKTVPRSPGVSATRIGTTSIYRRETSCRVTA